ALVSRGAGFAERNGDGLSAALDLAPSSAATTFELAMLELMHHTSGRLPLSGGGLGHGVRSWVFGPGKALCLCIGGRGKPALKQGGHSGDGIWPGTVSGTGLSSHTSHELRLASSDIAGGSAPGTCATTQVVSQFQ